MLELQNSEIELARIFILGLFLGWISRKYLKGHGRHTPWTIITNMKYPFMNISRKELKVEMLTKRTELSCLHEKVSERGK